MAHSLRAGIILSFITMILWALHDVGTRYVAVTYHVEPFIFICLMFFIAAIVLIGCAGPGGKGLSTLKRGHTWFYGLINIGMNLAELYALLYITAAEMNFLNRMTVIMSLMATWVFFHRKPYKTDILGASLVFLGLLYIVANLESDVRWFAVFSVFISAALSTASAMVGETHTDNIEAKTFREKARVTGFVLLACSFLFLLTTFAMSYAKGLVAAELAAANPILAMAPNLSAFMHQPTFYAALVLGVTVVPLSMYFFFSATKTAKTETFMVVSSTLPFLTFFFEWLAFKFGLLDIRAISSGDLAAGVMVVTGAFLMQYLRYRHDKAIATGKKIVTATTDDYDMVCAALSFCKGDMLACAKKLGVPIEELEAVYAAKGSRGFNAKGNTYKLILRNYHRNIATADPLTGLTNKDSLLRAIETALSQKEPATVVFIDLNKFKPVNDTYGHEAGDLVLKTVAKRLVEALDDGSLVARIGGDEFALLLRTDKEQAQKITAKLSKQLLKPIMLADNHTQVSVGASFGLAQSGVDGANPEQLLAVADKAMYKNKKSER